MSAASTNATISAISHSRFVTPAAIAGLTRRRIQPRIIRSKIENSQRLGRHRWVVERALAWFARFRRLAIRYDRCANIHLAFSTLAAALIVWRFIER